MAVIPPLLNTAGRLEPLLVLVSLGHFVESLLVDDQIVVPRNLDISRILGPSTARGAVVLFGDLLVGEDHKTYKGPTIGGSRRGVG